MRMMTKMVLFEGEIRLSLSPDPFLPFFNNLLLTAKWDSLKMVRKVSVGLQNKAHIIHKMIH